MDSQVEVVAVTGGTEWQNERNARMAEISLG